VLIHAWGTPRALDDFVRRVRSESPPLARIDVLESCSLDGGEVPSDFKIAGSDRGPARTAVVPDAATCVQCLADVENAVDRRCGYAFTNCTHCGPRLSIVRGVPYDRASTSMSEFGMCARCRLEYEDPDDRRFHAQPIACPDCGPALWLEDEAGRSIADDAADAMEAARTHLLRGDIVALKGLGGFHVACDALNAATVARLRHTKQRSDKPLALMARSVEVIRRYCAVSPAAEAVLSSPAAPIVVLPSTGRERVAALVAPRVSSLGFMLPNTPLHHQLLKGVDRPIVLTSGNLSDEPPCTDNDEARRRLAPVARIFLMHDRAIANRVDDSVVRIVQGRVQMLRRARGYAPAPLRLPEGFEKAPQVLAMGGELKNTFCLIKDGQAVLSQHIGDLKLALAHEDYRKNLDLFAALFDLRPEVIAVDLHPDYLSSQRGRQLADEESRHLAEIQHHHAHIAACMFDNGWPADGAKVLGVALDGMGYGSDATPWGGELLLADYRSFERLGRLAPVAMLGGAQAIREPWRSTYAHIVRAIGWRSFERDHARLELCRDLGARPRAALDSMLAAGVNCPMTSSCGRLFDAVAAALGLCRDRVSYEGQAAMELEALAERSSVAAPGAGYPFAVTRQNGGLMELDAAPMWTALLEDLMRPRSAASIAASFHRGLADGLTRIICALADALGARRFKTVALSGGVFQNALLFEAVFSQLRDAGFGVLAHARVPSHDGGLSLGQAAIAAARAGDFTCA
jgi:hydrogenase maturation protein HypF